MQEKRWKIEEVDQQKVDELQQELGINRTLCRLLILRQIDTFDKAKKFFRPGLNDLYDPLLMKDMDRAVARICTAIRKKEKILIYGDYDVDGTTAVSTMLLYFRHFYPGVEYYIPDRYKEGYGISDEGIEFATREHFDLVIALDCGIRAVGPISRAAQKGVDFIVCDHHLPGDQLPQAVAILDPKQPGCTYPFKELSGCGIGLKLVQALIKEWKQPEEWLLELLDLAAISIAADIVPIIDENRILAHFGLKKINKKPLPGIGQLIRSANLRPPLNISNIVFGIAPRINAAGRMSDARDAVRLLVGEKKVQNEEGARLLNKHNLERKDLDKMITEDALRQIKEDTEYTFRKTTVVYSPDWHKGVVGIVASRLMEQHYRPTIVLTKSNEMIAGSARSVRNFNIYKALCECSDLLEKFGGHKYAAGMELRPENLEAFQKRFEEVVSERISDEDLLPSIAVEAEIRLEEITASFFKILRQFAPFGPSNPNPVFISRRVKDIGYGRIVGDEHLKLSLTQGGQTMDAIAFRQHEKLPLIRKGKYIDICYSLEENEFQGMKSIQLNIKDIKPSE